MDNMGMFHGTSPLPSWFIALGAVGTNLALEISISFLVKSQFSYGV